MKTQLREWPRLFTTAPTRGALAERLWQQIAGNEPAVIAAALGSFAVACALLLVLPGGTFFTYAPHDTFIFVDAAYRLAHGQLPNLDYRTPLGVLSAVLPYFGLMIGGSFAAAMPVALAAALLVLSPMLVWVLATRFRVYLAVPVGALLILLVAAPLITGDVPSRITMAMWYNRLGWAVLSVLLLMWMPPNAQRPRAWLVDGIVAAALVLILVYTKITFGLIAIAFLAIWFALVRGARPAAALAGLICIAAAGGIELVWQLHRPYLDDILFAAQAGPPVRGGLVQLLRTPLKFAGEVALLGLVIAQLVALRRASVRDCVFFAFVLAGSLLIINQNSEDASLACLIAALAVAAERVCRTGGLEAGTTPRIARVASFGLVLALIAEPLVYRSYALLMHYQEARNHLDDPTRPLSLAGFSSKEYKNYAIVSHGPEVLQAITRPGLDDATAFALLRDRTFIGAPNLLSTTEYLYTIGQGVNALSSLDYQDKLIFNFDIVNPFPFVLGTPPQRGALYCHHLDRQYSLTTFLPAEVALGAVEIVLIPKFPMEIRDRAALLHLYGDYLRAQFAATVDTPYWTVWTRRDAPHPLAPTITGPLKAPSAASRTTAAAHRGIAAAAVFD
jgi:hypothetical protein